MAMATGVVTSLLSLLSLHRLTTATATVSTAASFSSLKTPSPSFPVLISTKLPPLTRHNSSAIKASTTFTESQDLKIDTIPTKPIEGQKTGTSGLRKKVKVFMQENYLGNGIQLIIKIAAGVELVKFWLASYPGRASLFDSDVRGLTEANGGFIMSASHNPGGPEYDWGINVEYDWACVSSLFRDIIS